MTAVRAPCIPTNPLGLVCPACCQALQRRQRHFGDRLLALFDDAAHPLRRYGCVDPRCGWQGLLRGHLPRPPDYLPEHWL